MGFMGLRVLAQARKLVIRSVRTSYAVCYDHPVFLGLFLFLIFLYRSFPLLFSLLVTSSPVLVCSFLLLGTLLSFGHPQIPEFEIDENINSEVLTGRTMSLENITSYEKDEVLATTDTSQEALGESSGRGTDATSMQNDVDLVNQLKEHESLASHPLTYTQPTSWEIEFEKLSFEGPQSQSQNQEIEPLKASHQDRLIFEGVALSNAAIHDQCVIHEVSDQNLVGEKSVEGLVDCCHTDEDSLASSSTSWTWVKVDNDDDGNGDGGGEDDDNDNDDELLDSGSDGAESSSPDPSMADIIPLLDELYPLLENGNPKAARAFGQSSDMLTDRIQKSNESSSSDEESDRMEAEDDADTDVDIVQGHNKDGIISAIDWTEDDKRNLMEFGSSEVQKDHCLESLVASGAARRNTRMTTARKLIDLNGTDLPIQIPHTSTAPINPFDSEGNPCSYVDLPPFFGSSAQSVLLPRQSSFDLPDDLSNEKTAKMGDWFHQELTQINQRDPLFQRHESFNVGSSVFEFHRHESQSNSQVSQFRPYFTLERIDSVGIDYSLLARKSSDLSECSSSSRLSESSSSKRQSSDTTLKASSAAEMEATSVDAVEEEMKVNGGGFSPETRSVSKMDETSDLIVHGSQSSYILDSVSDDQYEKRKLEHNAEEMFTSERLYPSERSQIVEFKSESSGTDVGERSWLSETENVSAFDGRGAIEINLVPEPVDKIQGSSSSFPSLSELNDDVREEIKKLVKEVFCKRSDFSLEKESDLSGITTTSGGSAPVDSQLISGGSERKKGISGSSSSASSEDFKAEKEGVKVNQDIANVHPQEPQVDCKPESPDEEAQEMTVNKRASGFDEISEFLPDLIHGAQRFGNTSDIRDSVFLSSLGTANKDSSISSDFQFMEEVALSDEKDSKRLEIQVGDQYDVGKKVYDVPENIQLLNSVDLDLASAVERDTKDVEDYVSSQAPFLSQETNFTGTPSLACEENVQLQELAPESVINKHISALDEEYFLSADRYAVHSRDDVHSKFQKVGSVDNLDDPIHAESSHSYILCEQAVDTSGVTANESEQKPVISSSDLSESMVGETDPRSELSGPIPCDKFLCEKINDINGMDELFFSELDAVGDFKVLDSNADGTTDLNISSEISKLEPLKVGDILKQESLEVGKDAL